MPVDPSMFPSWLAKSELTKRPKRKDYEHSPQASDGGASFAKLVRLDGVCDGFFGLQWCTICSIVMAFCPNGTNDGNESFKF